MSFNPQKMANLILRECEFLEERYEGYEKKLVDVIVEILQAEKKNLVQSTHIQKQVNEICYKAGDFLMEKLNISEIEKEKSHETHQRGI